MKTPEDWNSITNKQLLSNGGRTLTSKYTMYDLKCMACPEGESIFDKPIQQKPSKFWKDKKNILQFLDNLRAKYNLNTPEDWNCITTKQIKLNGGSSLFGKYSMFELKCLACPDGKLIFDRPKQSKGFWEDKQNIIQFLDEIKVKYNVKTPEDWNSISSTQIKLNGGNSLFHQYSMYDLKCMACPEGESIFDKPIQQKPMGYWKDKQNILLFLENVKYNLNLKTIEDWNSITKKQIISLGGSRLLFTYSMYDLKCLACPEGKLIFKQVVDKGYWDNKQNIHQFLNEIKAKYNVNTPEEWNLISRREIVSNGGSRLLSKYSMYDLKCIACPEGKSIFMKPHQTKASEYWEDENNRNKFLDKLKNKYNLKTPQDWERLSVGQIKSQGGRWLFYENNHYLDKTKITFKISDKNGMTKIESYNLSDLVAESSYKRSSQRWLFLQIQNLFPHEEIIEDYFHSELSRITGCTVQFDIFLINRNIAIEYHGKQHYEDIPAGFATLEMHKSRDEEKRNLCKKHGIKLIIIPYWWDNKLDSLRTTLNSEMKL